MGEEYGETRGCAGRVVRTGSLPKNYRLLLEVVRAERGRHLTAHEIYVEARSRQPTLGFATVHRGLIRLCELGDIMKIEMPGRDAAWYEAAAPAHAHLQCLECGAMVDVEYHTPEQTLASIAAGAGLEITSEVVMFRGRCSRCARRSQQIAR
jgi:Fur family ferric uptake transcriptional regulator